MKRTPTQQILRRCSFAVAATRLTHRRGDGNEGPGTRIGMQADWLGLTTAWRSRYPRTLLRVVSGY
jgi:hypothetical protein